MLIHSLHSKDNLKLNTKFGDDWTHILTLPGWLGRVGGWAAWVGRRNWKKESNLKSFGLGFRCGNMNKLISMIKPQIPC